MGLFGKGKDPVEEAKEKVNDLSSKLRSETRLLDRQIRGIEREEQKTIDQVKLAAKKGHKDVCKVLAKSLVHSKKQKARIYASKAEINSVILKMKEQVAQMKMTGCIQKSTEVMKSMQNLVKLPELQKTAQELSKEMMKAGIIEEMIDDTIDNVLDDDDVEELADEEVEKIINEVTKGQLKDLPSIASGSIGVGEPKKKQPAAAAAAAVSSDEGEPEEEMVKRLEALRS